MCPRPRRRPPAAAAASAVSLCPPAVPLSPRKSRNRTLARSLHCPPAASRSTPSNVSGFESRPASVARTVTGPQRDSQLPAALRSQTLRPLAWTAVVCAAPYSSSSLDSFISASSTPAPILTSCTPCLHPRNQTFAPTVLALWTPSTPPRCSAYILAAMVVATIKCDALSHPSAQARCGTFSGSNG